MEGVLLPAVRLLYGIMRVLLAWLFIATVAMGAVGVLLACSLLPWDAWSRHTRPAFIRGLPDAFPDAKRVFNERVLSTFPVGLPEAELRRKLESEGFSRCGYSTKCLSYGIHNLVCSQHWAVHWQTDDLGAVSKVWGYARRACL